MAGWIAAATLARRLDPDLYEITIVESSHVGNTSVGESVVPPVVSFLRDLGLDEQELIHKTKAGLKLGIQFQGWSEKNGSYFHPFGTLGRQPNGLEFFQYWLKARSGGDTTPLTSYSPSAVMARNGKGAFPFKLAPDSPLAGAEYALHLDSSLVVRFLRDFAEHKGVKCINAHVVRVRKHENGDIQSLELNNGQNIVGRLFIDCSGIRSLLIGEALTSPYESWQHYLPCDRAVVVQSAYSGKVNPYMISRAQESGWSWHIPLQDRISQGYVFSSEYSSDHQAKKLLLDEVDGDPLYEPYFIPFRTGIRKQAWKMNCVALGLSGGFLEPLESTAIQLITRSVQYLLDLFPGFSSEGQDWSGLAAEYNARIRTDYEEVRDFLILHYCTSRRSDTEFWRRCQSYPVPEGLTARIRLFADHGQLRLDKDMMFQKRSWQSVFTGMGVVPRRYHPFADMGDFERIHKKMRADVDSIEAATRALPDYQGFQLN